jgi:hypothetical protein
MEQMIINSDRLVEVLSIQSESYNQWRMFAYIIRQAKSLGVTYEVHNGNIYITKGEADSYPCVVAHMDTVHRIHAGFTVVRVGDNLTGFNRWTMEQSGIGGDDKVGVFIALEMLRQHEVIKLAFFRDEEVGCHGSYKAKVDFFHDCNIVLQCDRKGNSDFVIKAGGTELSSEAFQADAGIILSAHGYKTAHGMMTDVMALKELGIACSMANISCGYYNPHMDDEYVNISDVENCMNMVSYIIHYLGWKLYYHLPVKAQRTKYDNSYWGDWSGWSEAGVNKTTYAKKVVNAPAAKPATKKGKKGKKLQEKNVDVESVIKHIERYQRKQPTGAEPLHEEKIMCEVCLEDTTENDIQYIRDYQVYGCGKCAYHAEKESYFAK